MIAITARTALAGLCLASLAACNSNGSMDPDSGMMGGGMMGGGMMGMSMVRHHHAMHDGLPDEYAGLDNPLPASSANLTSGGELYAQHCAVCHGPQGRGDGPGAAGLQPRPANIARFARMPMASDDYLYWTIAEGGAPVGSAMPAFKDVLESDAIWRIILHLRRL